MVFARLPSQINAFTINLQDQLNSPVSGSHEINEIITPKDLDGSKKRIIEERTLLLGLVLYVNAQIETKVDARFFIHFESEIEHCTFLI